MREALRSAAAVPAAPALAGFALGDPLLQKLFSHIAIVGVDGIVGEMKGVCVRVGFAALEIFERGDAKLLNIRPSVHIGKKVVRAARTAASAPPPVVVIVAAAAGASVVVAAALRKPRALAAGIAAANSISVLHSLPIVR